LTSFGIAQGLITITESENPKLSRRAALLIGELLQLAARVLPAQHNSQVQALPRLFTLAASFDNLPPRLSASAALASVDSINRNRARLISIVQPAQKRSRSDSLEDAGNQSATIRLQVENSKMRAGYQIDDASFRNQLLESGVLQNPTSSSNASATSSWNIEVITDLLEGALLNPRRLEEVIKGTKFLRRLMLFYHPLERKYSDLPRTPVRSLCLCEPRSEQSVRTE
jgi:rapamycin-insensitive companion of mTOR